MLMSISIPHLEIMIPLVGVTSGTFCALIYPPIFEMITFWNDWKVIFLKNIVLFLMKYFIHSSLFSSFNCNFVPEFVKLNSNLFNIFDIFLKQSKTSEIQYSKEH